MQPVIAFAGALVASTTLFLLPSEPFQRLMFSFSLQSWFHLLVAFATALLSLEFALLRRSVAGLSVIVLTSIAVLAALFGQVMVGGDFLSGHLVNLAQMSEVKGFAGYLGDGQWRELLQMYSGLLLFLPFGLAWLLWRLQIERDDESLFFAVAAACGVALACDQLRFENYGSFAILLLPFMWIESRMRLHQRHARQLVGAMTILCLLACGPTVPALTSRIPLGGNLQHQSTLQVYAWLANACQERAGTVLADSSDGHPIEYYSACSVIADNFIITRQHEDKLREADRLMASSLDEVLAEAPYVRYIYVIRHDDPFSSTCGGGCPENRGLRAQLLFNGPPYPSRLKLLGKIDLKGADPNGTAMPLARVFEVTPAIPGVP